MYIPVLKNRSIEVSAIKILAEMNVFDNNIIPLIEIIQEKTRGNMKDSFLEELCKIIYNSPNSKFILDFYKSSKIRNTNQSVKDYLNKVNRQPDFYINELLKLSNYSNNIIPTISFETELFNKELIFNHVNLLRNTFNSLAFRIHPNDFDNIFDNLKQIINNNDLVILDIESASHTSPVLKRIYKVLDDERKNFGYRMFIISAHRSPSLYNINMLDKEPIAEIDNSLLEMYSQKFMHKFDGFGDYATISPALPSTGGSISPVGIYYSYESNFFVSFKARKPVLSEFPDYIAPSIVNSEYWTEYADEHHKICPGCKEIIDIIDEKKPGRSQGQWKLITILHYIYTMFENNV